jgi:hypothetical protein
LKLDDEKKKKINKKMEGEQEEQEELLVAHTFCHRSMSVRIILLFCAVFFAT